jgi:hypothetical protein
MHVHCTGLIDTKYNTVMEIAKPNPTPSGDNQKEKKIGKEMKRGKKGEEITKSPTPKQCGAGNLCSMRRKCEPRPLVRRGANR